MSKVFKDELYIALYPAGKYTLGSTDGVAIGKQEKDKPYPEMLAPAEAKVVERLLKMAAELYQYATSIIEEDGIDQVGITGLKQIVDYVENGEPPMQRRVNRSWLDEEEPEDEEEDIG